jgi:cytidylate kinase
METITLITGAPGCGKTAVSKLLAERNPRGVHIPSDIFYTFPAHPIRPHLPAANAQNQAVIAAALHASSSLARHRYDVFLDGIFGPWFLPFIASELAPSAPSIQYVILQAPLKTALRRICGRTGHMSEDVVCQMHGEFEACLGRYGGNVVETEGRSAADAADLVLRGRERGDFLLVLAAIGNEP